MKASEIMTTGIVTVSPGASIEEAAKLMIKNRVSGLPVVDNGALCGIVSEGDLLRRSETGTEKPRSWWLRYLLSPGRQARDYVRTHARRVDEIMTRTVISVGPQTPVADVVALMESRRIKRVPVVEQGRLVGIISRANLVAALVKVLPPASGAAVSDREIRQQVLRAIEKQSWAPKSCIDAKVENGAVELTGIITDGREREALRVVAENVPGVKAVHDDLAWIDPVTDIIIEDKDQKP